MNGGNRSSTNGGSDEPPSPKKLELTLHPEDGSLQTVPLYHVLLAATDALYNDLYNMAQGEIDVSTTTTTAGTKQPPPSQDMDGDEGEVETTSDGAMIVSPTSIQHKKERMTNLSFAQRRHELSWRLSQNMKGIQQVAALTSYAASGTNFGSIVNTSTKALQHTRTAWVQADEAQDAMYFFHAQLFPSRMAPCDIYGASDVLLHGKWYDLPYDMLLNVDRYHQSMESTWSKYETDQRWQLTVREKLITGEVGYIRQQQLLNDTNSHSNHTKFESPLWKVSLTGGIVKLTAGRPKQASSTLRKYPIEAMLTVFPSKHNIWTLMSVEVNVQAKTGEFNHQLDMSHRQRYDLHRIAMTAMRREEIRYHQDQAAAALSNLGSATLSEMEDYDNKTHTNDGGDTTNTKYMVETIPKPSQPLQALFQVAHMFLMAWQLELISAQAQALRRGVWAGAATTTTKAASDITSHNTSLISVTPVRFFDNSDGHMSISFWKVDDSYGPPSMGDLNRHSHNNATTIPNAGLNPLSHPGLASSSSSSAPTPSSSQLTLTIRAESSTGIIVSLSGGTDMINMDGPRQPNIQGTINDLIEAATNPMALSASDALLAATKLCAEFKCQAVVDALQPTTNTGSSTIANNINPFLPPWIQLSVQSGCIAVATNLSYHGIPTAATEPSRKKAILFQLICNARTGSFVVTFPRSMHLLRQLACDDIHASAPVALRIASVPLNRRRIAGSNSTGRVVREAFDSLVRSMNLLGERVGVGGSWDDIDDRSYLLRQRAVQSACTDVKTALISCCGMTALYGVVPLALGTSIGLAAIPDM